MSPEKGTEGEEIAKAERTREGKYKCRTCGQEFDTLEAHDEHHREMHERKGEPGRHPAERAYEPWVHPTGLPSPKPLEL